MIGFRKYHEICQDRLDERDGGSWCIDDCDLYEGSLNEAGLSRDLDLLRKKFKKGTVTFEYNKKSSGEKRVAHGTLNFKRMKKDGFHIDPIPNYISQRMKEHPNLFVYYDMDKHNWRCFDMANFRRVYK